MGSIPKPENLRMAGYKLCMCRRHIYGILEIPVVILNSHWKNLGREMKKFIFIDIKRMTNKTM